MHSDLTLAVEGISRARVKIDPILGLDGNRSVAVDFYFPDRIGGVRQLRYWQDSPSAR